MQGPAVADDSLSANMADEARPHSTSADGGFNEHKATIARLYLVEGRTLEDVREIMAETHRFTASYVSPLELFTLPMLGDSWERLDNSR